MLADERRQHPQGHLGQREHVIGHQVARLVVRIDVRRPIQIGGGILAGNLLVLMLMQVIVEEFNAVSAEIGGWRL